jgi:hypothetical protein
MVVVLELAQELAAIESRVGVLLFFFTSTFFPRHFRLEFLS